MPLLFTPGSGPVASIINRFSSGGVSVSNVENFAVGNTLEVTAPGAYTSGVLQTVISHTGRGRLNILSVYCKDSTSRTLRCRITLDGVVVFDATSNAIAASTNGIVPVGYYATVGVAPQQIDYQSSLLVEVASSLSEAAANVGIAVNRETWAS
jgi:hypothetical protein